MAGFRFRLRQMSLQFWFVPAMMTVVALVLAQVATWLSSDHPLRDDGPAWIYSGGVDGSRSILSAVASSSIGVGGTVFSITIAALAYAAGSMGPRLLQNFTEDRGNQVTLGVFISTFAFSLFSLRTVTSGDEGAPFVPHYNVTIALGLALACIAALVYFIGHVTGSINTTRVVNLLTADLRQSLLAATRQDDPDRNVTEPPDEDSWAGAETLQATRSGYLQLVDHDRLVTLAKETGTRIRLLSRPGDYIFPAHPVAEAVPTMPDGVMSQLTIGATRTREQDVEYAVRLLGEMGARALSPGTNDPFTAIDVIDRFGDALCSLKDRSWPTGAYTADGEVRLVMPTSDFEGLVAAMFEKLRQYGANSPPVTIRILEVLQAAATVLDTPHRRAVLAECAARVRDDALRETPNETDRGHIARRYRAVLTAARSS